MHILDVYISLFETFLFSSKRWFSFSDKYEVSYTTQNYVMHLTFMQNISYVIIYNFIHYNFEF